MNLYQGFIDVANLAGHRLSLIAQAVAKATVDVPAALYGSVVDAFSTQANNVVGYVQDGAQTLENAASDGFSKLVDDLGGVGSAVAEAVKAPFDLGYKVVEGSVATIYDALSGKIDFDKIYESATDVQNEFVNVINSVNNLASSTSSAISNIYSDLTQGNHLKFGDTDGLLGINFSGSVLGGDLDNGVIPNERGFTGPIPISVSWDKDGLILGGETPITSLFVAALSTVPFTAPIIPLISPLNFGGLGSTTKITAEGFELKNYAVTGPSYQSLSGVDFKAVAEVGSYTSFSLLKWNSVALKELPVVGDLLKYIPVVNDISLTYPTVEISVDSKLYAQGAGGVSFLGKGPNTQIEVVHDIDNDVAILSNIVSKTFDAVVKSGENIVASIFAPLDSKSIESLQPPAVFEADVALPAQNSVQLVGLGEQNISHDMLAA